MTPFLISAFSVGMLHALMPDHWFGFVAIARAQNWTRKKLLGAIFFAGLAHVSLAFFIGVGGKSLGVSLSQMAHWDTSRAGFFSLLLAGFGLAYLVWAVKRWNAPRLEMNRLERSFSSGFLFSLLVLGPCEPMIPFLFTSKTSEIPALFFIFAAATVGTMLLASQLVFRGLSLWKIPGLHRISHMLAGASMVTMGITFFVFKI